MTNQVMFNKVAKHLLKQGNKATEMSNGACRYRGIEGRKCAIGCLIPDNKYDPSWEGDTPESGDTAHAICRAAGITKQQIPFAMTLQRVHDENDPPQWREVLRGVAARYRLTMPRIR